MADAKPTKKSKAGGTREGAGRKAQTVNDASGAAYVLFTKARAKERHHKAIIAEAEAGKVTGRLVEIEQVRWESYRINRMTHDAVMALPERISSILVGRTERQILTELRRECRQLLNTLADEVAQNIEIDFSNADRKD